MRNEFTYAARQATFMYFLFSAFWIGLVWASAFSYRHNQTCQLHNAHHTAFGPVILAVFAVGAAFLAAMCAKTARDYHQFAYNQKVLRGY